LAVRLDCLARPEPGGGYDPRMATGEAGIVEVERHLGVRFPDDYRRFLATRGSLAEFVPPAGDYLSIDPVDQVIGINQAGEIAERFPGAVVRRRRVRPRRGRASRRRPG
jgi:hypothetical protein